MNKIIEREYRSTIFDDSVIAPAYLDVTQRRMKTRRPGERDLETWTTAAFSFIPGL